ncbi:hypothetical protein F2Q69_00035425 [Brassica cretica]|uniref:Uncharacterized protein n=1 Tax=Brassica cretica TaxID=69181 RepID=A0A8S9SKM3_BRACR|nr:hypothetical protein F2Q69_00035425 [Brassica cretica]
MGATSPERHREVAVTPFQSDLTGATQRGRSRIATQSDVSQRPLQVAPEAWSDLSERLLEVAARRIGVPHGVLGDIWVHLELKRGDKGDHWTSSAWERPHRSDTVKSL